MDKNCGNCRHLKEKVVKYFPYKPEVIHWECKKHLDKGRVMPLIIRNNYERTSGVCPNWEKPRLRKKEEAKK